MRFARIEKLVGGTAEALKTTVIYVHPHDIVEIHDRGPIGGTCQIVRQSCGVQAVLGDREDVAAEVTEALSYNPSDLMLAEAAKPANRRRRGGRHP